MGDTVSIFSLCCEWDMSPLSGSHVERIMPCALAHGSRPDPVLSSLLYSPSRCPFVRGELRLRVLPPVVFGKELHRRVDESADEFPPCRRSPDCCVASGYYEHLCSFREVVQCVLCAVILLEADAPGIRQRDPEHLVCVAVCMFLRFHAHTVCYVEL